jgi:hypothetical protein
MALSAALTTTFVNVKMLIGKKYSLEQGDPIGPKFAA